jgi:hypothetical protein
LNLLTLPAVAEETRQPERRLRRWCATGKLRCERDGPAWLIPTSELPEVERLARGRRSGEGSGPTRALLGLALPRAHGHPSLASELAALLGLDSDRVKVRELAIDGEPYVVAAWMDHPGREATTALEDLAAERGGELLEELNGSH